MLARTMIKLMCLSHRVCPVRQPLIYLNAALSNMWWSSIMARSSTCVPAMIAAIMILSLAAGCDQPTGSTSEAGAIQAAALHESLSFKFAANPGKDERERFEFAGISIVPPQGENWIEGPHHPEPNTNYFGLQPLVTFVKVLPQKSDDPHSVLARVAISYLPANERPTAANDQRDYIRYMMEKEVATARVTKGGRFPVKSVEAKLDDTLGICFRIDMIAEDRGAPGTVNLPAMIDTHGYQCLAPSSRFYIFAFYTQRVPVNAKPVDLSSEGEAFLNSIKFLAGEG